MLAGGGDRDYLACERCGRVAAVQPEDLEALRAQLRDAYGYEVRFSHFPMVGRCEECRSA